jgi:hypothetical protein
MPTLLFYLIQYLCESMQTGLWRKLVDAGLSITEFLLPPVEVAVRAKARAATHDFGAAAESTPRRIDRNGPTCYTDFRLNGRI